MKIYDISQEVFGCQVYAGDPVPEKKLLQWKCTSSCWEPVSYCLKESVWQKFRKAFIS